MEYLAILTLEIPGRASGTFEATVTAGNGLTRQGLLAHMKQNAAEECGSDWATATVTFFSVEPNQLATSN